MTLTGSGQHVTRTITASNGAKATVAVSGLDIDLHRPTVRVTGPRARHTYLHRVPKARCRASESPSGIASCRIVKVSRRGKRETITARATTRAGVSRTIKVTFNI